MPTKTKTSPGSEGLIAQDFVNTMMQIDRLSPQSTVLQFDASEGNDIFGAALRTAAAEKGYAVQAVNQRDGANFVKFSVSELSDFEAGAAFTYDVSVGDVDFRRVYKPLTNGRVEPHKGMLVRGADVSNIEPNDSIFYDQPVKQTTTPLIADKQSVEQPEKPRSGFDSPVARKDQQRRLASEAQEIDVAVTSPTTELPKLIAKPIEKTVSHSENAVQTGDNAIDIQNTIQKDNLIAEVAPVSQSVSKNIIEAPAIAKRNLAESGTSNYDNLLSEKQNVAEEILIFGDDSYVLGARNKKILNHVMGSFNPETDVISVVGCSTGTTKITNGNAALAIGRANRVKEALLYSGISHDKIFDEGCWSPNANSTPFPNRGVVVTVKRGVKNG